MSKIRRCKDCKIENNRFGDRCYFCEDEFERKQIKLKKRKYGTT